MALIQASLHTFMHAKLPALRYLVIDDAHDEIRDDAEFRITQRMFAILDALPLLRIMLISFMNAHLAPNAGLQRLSEKHPVRFAVLPADRHLLVEEIAEAHNSGSENCFEPYFTVAKGAE